MKVRLKHNTNLGSALLNTAFQFHEGSIKTKKFIMISTAFHKFQFHEGSIKTKLLPKTLLDVLGFNSMKVRLKLVFCFGFRFVFT